jgi:hypothetical protein
MKLLDKCRPVPLTVRIEPITSPRGIDSGTMLMTARREARGPKRRHDVDCAAAALDGRLCKG